MDIFRNPQYQLIYLTKMIRYGSMFAAVYLAEKILEDWYVRRVFVDNLDPPNLLSFIGIVIGLDASFNLMMVFIIYLISLLVNQPENGQAQTKAGGSQDTILNLDFIGMYITDWVFTTMVLFLFTWIVSSVMQKKKYFRYKLEGMRGIRALKEIVLGMMAILIFFPFFLIYASVFQSDAVAPAPAPTPALTPAAAKVPNVQSSNSK